MIPNIQLISLDRQSCDGAYRRIAIISNRSKNLNAPLSFTGVFDSMRTRRICAWEERKFYEKSIRNSVVHIVAKHGIREGPAYPAVTSVLHNRRLRCRAVTSLLSVRRDNGDATHRDRELHHLLHALRYLQARLPAPLPRASLNIYIFIIFRARARSLSEALISWIERIDRGSENGRRE